MRGHHHHLPAHRDAVTQRQAPPRASQHHTGHIVAVKHEGALYGALRQHDFGGADAPQALAGAGGSIGRYMVGQPLCRADEIVVVISKRRGAGQHAHTRSRQLGPRLIQPFGLRRVRQCSAADLLLLVDQDDAALTSS